MTLPINLYHHRNCYYFRKRYPRTRLNCVVSLKTDSLQKAKFLLAMIMPSVKALFARYKDDAVNFFDYRDEMFEIITNYVKEAIVEYGVLESKRHRAYTFRSKKGKLFDGGHPDSIEQASQILMDAVFDDETRDAVYSEIISRSNINT